MLCAVRFGKLTRASYSYKKVDNADIIYNEFEWNAEKSADNLKKHDVSFEEATTVFDDPFFLIFKDSDHSFDEQRFIIIGMSDGLRYLFVSFAERAERIRIISARELTTAERRSYEYKKRF